MAYIYIYAKILSAIILDCRRMSLVFRSQHVHWLICCVFASCLPGESPKQLQRRYLIHVLCAMPVVFPRAVITLWTWRCLRRRKHAIWIVGLQVSAGVPRRHACPPRFSGCDVFVFFDACSRSTVIPRRLTSTCTMSCTRRCGNHSGTVWLTRSRDFRASIARPSASGWCVSLVDTASAALPSAAGPLVARSWDNTRVQLPPVLVTRGDYCDKATGLHA